MLEKINPPNDLKKLSISEMEIAALEIRTLIMMEDILEVL